MANKELTRFDCVSPVDYRYYDKEAAEHLSEEAFIRYKLKVELALIDSLVDYGICPADVLTEVTDVCGLITAMEVYEEEDRIHHDIRALTNCISGGVRGSAKRFVHLGATSFDISDTANACRYKIAIKRVLIPALSKLEKVLIELTRREAGTRQVGRTHGQHAVPITFGFALAEYVARLGECILALEQAADNLVGKFSGAVGAYNASSLFIEDPQAFERDLLKRLDLKPATHSTQIVAPEPLIRLFSEITLTGGVIANLCRDMRNLQRTEIGEVGEEFEADQVGSSTMPQKRNPINFENAESLWKVLVGRMVTVLLDQISDHQRDLTNSASARTYGEGVIYLVGMTKRITKTLGKMSVDKESLERNLKMQGSLIAAEPLYILMAGLGYPTAHEKVRQLTLESQRTKRDLGHIAAKDQELSEFMGQLTEYQRAVIATPRIYIGKAIEKALGVADHWEKKLGFTTE